MTNLSARRGNTLTITLPVLKIDGTAFNLADATTLTFVIRHVNHPDESQAEALLLFTWTGVDTANIAVPSPISGIATITVDASVTQSLFREGWRLPYEAIITEGSDHETTVATGLITVAGGTGVTRRDLRRQVLRGVGDLVVLTATADGTNVSFPDYINLVGEVNRYKGQRVIITGGTPENIGQERYVQGSSNTYRLLDFGVDLPAQVHLGDEAELFSDLGKGYRFQDVNEAINQSISSVRNTALVPAEFDSPSFVQADGIEIPVNYRTIEYVKWLQTTNDATCDQWRSVMKAKKPGGTGWWVNRATRTIEINGWDWNIVAGRSIRVTGLVSPDLLYDDDDMTDLDEEWLVMSAQAIMTRARYFRMATPETERLMYMMSSEATRLTPKARQWLGPYSSQVMP